MEIIVWNQSSGNGSYRKAMNCLHCIFYNKTQTIKIMYKHEFKSSISMIEKEKRKRVDVAMLRLSNC